MDGLSLGQIRLFWRVCSAVKASGRKHTSTSELLKSLNKDPRGLPAKVIWPEDVTLKANQLMAYRVALARELKRIEEAVGLPADAVLLKWAGKLGIEDVTPEGRALAEVAEKVLEAYDVNSRRGGELLISISEAAATYQLPEVLAERAALTERAKRDGGDPPPTLRFMRADQNYVRPNGELASGQIDSVVAWNHALRGPNFAIAPQVEADPIKSSETEVCFLFHASHPFAHWLTHRPAGADFFGELKRYPILFPGDLKTLADLAASIVTPDLCLRTEGFPAVVALARLGVGVGLFPLWKSVLDRLRVEDQVYHEPWPADAAAERPLKIGLTHYRLKQGPRVEAANAFVRSLDRKFAEGKEEGRWRLAAWDRPFGERGLGPFRSRWQVHYANRGAGCMPYPAWRTGTWEFEPVGEGGSEAAAGPPAAGDGRAGSDPIEVGGTCRMSLWNEDKEQAVFALRGTLTSHFLQVFSTRLDVKGKAPERSHHSTISFVQALVRGEPQTAANTAVFGFIHTTPARGPTVAPFFLCPEGMAIDAKDYRDICGLVEFIMQAPERSSNRHEAAETGG